MLDRDYNIADREVIAMVNRGRGPGGELPTRTLMFIPTDRAERVEALDRRIEQLRRIAPWVIAALIAIVSGLVGHTI